MIVDWLAGQGIPAVFLREPTDGPVGQEIRRMAREGRSNPRREFELFLEDRAHDVATNIAPALERGAVVVMDRYYISSMAYQGALGIDPEEIRIANEAIAPRPDLVVLLEIDVASAGGRIRARDAEGPNEFERADYQQRVKAVFDTLHWPEVARVNAAQGIEAVAEQVRGLLHPFLEARAQGRRHRRNL